MAVSLENEQIKNDNLMLRKHLASTLTHSGLSKSTQSKSIQTDPMKTTIIVPDLTFHKKDQGFVVPAISTINDEMKQKLRRIISDL